MHREDCEREKSELGRKEKKEVRHEMGKSRKWEEKELVWWDVGDPDDDGEEREITSVPPTDSWPSFNLPSEGGSF